MAQWANEVFSLQVRVPFSVDRPYEQMPSSAHWFDEAQFNNELKLNVGRENAKQRFVLRSGAISASTAAGSGP